MRSFPKLIWALSAALVLARALPVVQTRAAEPTGPADYDSIIEKSDRQHWAFQPVRRPAIPQTRHRDWPRNAIDSFILARLEEKGWRPAEGAKPQAILRRLFLDMVGLPPAIEERDEFLTDSSPEAIDRWIERLLSRPGYGERWGRHWLDLVRYADSNGYERDAAKPSVWRYRDYVIRSFNDDKPYDRFLLEQLAGDELNDSSAETLTALGYYRLGPWDDEPADPAEDRFDQLDDMVSTTSQAVLGLTLGCARCHNHKFEPLTQLDYYRMTAVFNPLQRFQNGRNDLDAPVGSAAELAALAERDRKIAELASRSRALREAFQEEFLKAGRSQLDGEVVAAFLTRSSERNDAQKQFVERNSKSLSDEVKSALPEESRTAIAAIDAKIAELRKDVPDLPRAYFLHEPSPKAPETHLLLRGKPGRPGIVAPPGVPTVLVSQQPEFLPPGDRTSRRRLSFARWLVDPANPLTARVIVNRVWQFHFGEGLVRTPSDFGVMGSAPTHPELLDYLSAEFVRQGWSLKWLHRLILASSTYRMSREANAENAAADPENLLWWRFPYHRLEVEAIRDSMLHVSGRLDRAMFGPAMFPFIPREALEGNSDPDLIWPAYNEQTASRRTVYTFIKRSLVVPMIEVLDLCDTTKSSARRAVTSVAPQALTLFNGQFANEQAAHFADRLEREAGDDALLQIDRAWLLALCREPTALERRAMSEFLAAETARQTEVSAAAGSALDRNAARHRALVQLCRVIFNLNEFVYSD
jgi:hypothetical protein